MHAQGAPCVGVVRRSGTVVVQRAALDSAKRRRRNERGKQATGQTAPRARTGGRGDARDSSCGITVLFARKNR
jgi:hypothetical protein